MNAPAASQGLVRQRAGALVKRDRERVLLLRAAPSWTGPEELQIAGSRVRIRTAVSSLGALSECVARPIDEFLVILTDQPGRELGDAVLVHAWSNQVQQPDDWEAVQEITGAHQIDPSLRRRGWAAGALLDLRPAKGWPNAAAGNLTLNEAMGWLLARALGRELGTVWDSLKVLESLTVDREAWKATDPDLRDNLAAWAGETLGPESSLMLRAATATPISPLAIGLTMSVLWPGKAESQIQARTRLERYVGGGAIVPAAAGTYARDAESLALRMDEAGDSGLDSILVQTEKLLADLEWPAGATRSTILPAGLVARLEIFAKAVTQHLEKGAPQTDVETALADVQQHHRKRQFTNEIEGARMATRLVRWLSGADIHDSTTELTDSLERYSAEGGWVDRAISTLWSGSEHAAVGVAYRLLARRAMEIRAIRDRTAAAQLAAGTAMEVIPDGILPIERIVRDVVGSISQQHSVLLLVLDGMSMRVATEIAQEAGDLSWTELVPENRTHRLVGLAALPTITNVSRTTLLSGQLTSGGQAVEKKNFTALTGGVVFHKDDLRSGAGEQLPEHVLHAIAGGPRVVAAVLNTIDDALGKDSPDTISWDLSRITHLRALLNKAALANRVVVLVSDHGHVVERGGESRPGSGDQRWRSARSGPVQHDEVLVRGDRVIVPGNEAVLAVAEGLRYGSKAAGYHGGASLAEISIPILVLDRSLTQLKGWRAAPPQVPSWWNEPALAPAPEVSVRRIAPKKAAKPPIQETSLFELPKEPAPEPSRIERNLADLLIDSDLFARQMDRAKRAAPDRDMLYHVVAELERRGGRANRTTIASVAGVPEHRLGPQLAAMRRILNIESYDVLGEDPDGRTVVLDRALLTEQFELGG